METTSEGLTYAFESAHFESKIQTGLLEQTDRLENRIKLRKMKSVSSIKGV